MRKLLITGGAGFIGANFVHHWMGRYPEDEITVLDALTYAGVRHSISDYESRDNFRFVHGDIADEALVADLFQRHGFDTVVHFAAESHVDRSIHGPGAFVHTNVTGTHCLLNAARESWSRQPDSFAGKRFHHVSTDEVYGSLGENDPAFTETTSYDPRSPYSASKAASDHLVRAYHHTYGLNVTISNCSNNYGPYHFPEKLIPLTILNILHGKSVPIYGDGKNVRDWLYVTDHCRGIELILDNGEAGQTYNIGGECERGNLDTVNALCGIVDRLFREDAVLAERFADAPPAGGGEAADLVTFVKDRPGHDRRYAMNIDRIRNELGFQPRESFDSGLEKTVRWYLENEDWWRPLLDGTYEAWIKTQYKSG
ncbi:MAG: dTDP-glucose 4,6-dehydratase [Gammaproteobacteria bacterium]